MSRGESGRSRVKEDGVLTRKWTVLQKVDDLLTKSGRSRGKVDGLLTESGRSPLSPRPEFKKIFQNLL